MEIITRINDAVNGFAWGTFGLALLMGTGLICTFATGFLQFTKIGHWFKNTFGIINGRGRIFTILASFGAGNMAQINKISINIEETFLDGKEMGMFWGASNINWAIGVFLMALMTAILLGEIQTPCRRG